MTHLGLIQVAQRALDLDRAVTWYETVAGLPLIARFDEAAMAFFDLGGARLLLGSSHYPSSIYLEVDDIDATTRTLADRGARLHLGPTLVHTDHDGTFGTTGTEEWMSFVWDSEDNLVAFVERRVPGTG